VCVGESQVEADSCSQLLTEQLSRSAAAGALTGHTWGSSLRENIELFYTTRIRSIIDPIERQ
jgi:hypothetical protein